MVFIQLKKKTTPKVTLVKYNNMIVINLKGAVKKVHIIQSVWKWMTLMILLTLTYGVAPDSICSHHIFNRPSPAIRDNALNRFKYPLEACAVAGCLNLELISHLISHSNKYVHLKLCNNGKFAAYKWCNISIAEMYHFVGIS